MNKSKPSVKMIFLECRSRSNEVNLCLNDNQSEMFLIVEYDWLMWLLLLVSCFFGLASFLILFLLLLLLLLFLLVPANSLRRYDLIIVLSREKRSRGLSPGE